MKNSITKKIAKIFIVMSALFLIFGAIILYILSSEFTEYIVDFQKYKVEEGAEVIENYIDDLVIDLKSFYVLGEDIKKNDFSLTTTHIYQLFLVNKSVKEIRVANPEGMELAGVSRVGILSKESLKNISEEKFFQDAKADRIYISDVYQENNSFFIDIAVPYFANFNLVAVVRSKIALENIFNQLTQEELLYGGHFHILSDNGIFWAAPKGEFIGKDVSDNSFFKKIKNEKKVYGVDCPRGCLEEMDFNVIASAYPLKTLKGFLLMESDKSQVFGGYYAVKNIFIASIILFLTLIVIFIFIINLRVKKYIKVLTDGVFRFHEGKYEEKIILKTGDELEFIVWHLNYLALKIEQNIREKNEIIEKLKEVDVLKYNFIKTISHQLRTPISSMLWLLESLISRMVEKMTDEQKSILKDVYEANKNISQIINDMILMADIDDRKIVLERSPVDCDDIIESAMREVKNLADKKSIEIKYWPSKDHPEGCNLDAQKMKFIFVRLLDNAIKYSEDGKRVIIKSEVEGNNLIFSVVDNGIGIPQAEQSKIFAKFYRASNSYKMVQNSSGLSLYLIKYFVEIHGGKIWFVSREGEGTTFYFNLPVSK